MTASLLAVYGPTNPGKIERHVKPLADTANTTLVCINPGEPYAGLTYRTVPSWGIRPIGLAMMLFVTFEEVLRNEYDGVVSFSLFPHGCIALAAGRLAGLPVHLGILGIDLDVHVRAVYGGFVEVLLRQYDVVSVPGTVHRHQLQAIGVPLDRSVILANAIDTERFTPIDVDPAYDFLWIGRFGREKHPLRFLDVLAELDGAGLEFRAVMLGDGPLADAVERAVQARGLASSVDLPGWVDDPLVYYQRSDVFVLTSRRDALPLTLLEAMSTGVVPVVPRVGNVTDVVQDGHNGIVVDSSDIDGLVAALTRLHRDDAHRERLAKNAVTVRDRYSLDAAREDWAEILDVMGVRRTPQAESLART